MIQIIISIIFFVPTTNSVPVSGPMSALDNRSTLTAKLAGLDSELLLAVIEQYSERQRLAAQNKADNGENSLDDNWIDGTFNGNKLRQGLQANSGDNGTNNANWDCNIFIHDQTVSYNGTCFDIGIPDNSTTTNRNISVNIHDDKSRRRRDIIQMVVTTCCGAGIVGIVGFGMFVSRRRFYFTPGNADADTANSNNPDGQTTSEAPATTQLL